MREDEFVRLKESCKSKLTEDDWANLNCSEIVVDPATEKKRLFVALEKNVLINILVELGRKDLAWKVKNLEDSTNRFSG